MPRRISAGFVSFVPIRFNRRNSAVLARLRSFVSIRFALVSLSSDVCRHSIRFNTNR